jgi:hypothetical protein
MYSHREPKLLMVALRAKHYTERQLRNETGRRLSHFTTLFKEIMFHKVKLEDDSEL